MRPRFKYSAVRWGKTFQRIVYCDITLYCDWDIKNSKPSKKQSLLLSPTFFIMKRERDSESSSEAVVVLKLWFNFFYT